MKSVTLTALLLCSLGWVSVSGSEYQILDAEPGDDVTLRCSNISTTPSQTDWFRLVNRTKPSCISSMFSSNLNATPCDGFGNGKFNMTSNGANVFLQIKSVDLSDSGLYFCGFYIKANTIIETAIHLNIKGDAEADEAVDSMTQKSTGGMTNLTSVILAALSVFLIIVVIVLAVKIKKLQTGVNEVEPARHKSRDSDDLNYVALAFKAKPKRNPPLASEREMEPNVVYAVTKGTAARTATGVSSH